LDKINQSNFTMSLTGKLTRQNLTDYFKNADIDVNGTLDKAELKKAIQEIIGIDFDEQSVEEIFSLADKNGDGKIQLEEFIGLLEAI
jgi:Ca2+-binding EF-hand superfamily protein